MNGISWVASAFRGEGVWVFHCGALGDSVLLWPMLRALRERGAEVTLVAEGGKARLAARELGIAGVDAEQRRFNELWTAGSGPEAVGGVGRVVSFIADARAAPGRTWLAGAAAMFPGAAVECIQGPIDRVMALRLASGGGAAAARENPNGPIVLHVGAGSASKRWGMERWEGLEGRLRERGDVVVLAGEAEAERFEQSERLAMERVGGTYIADLAELAAILRAARVFIGADTGPTHLAAQLGIPTVALFGPTDPERWAPIGPRVRVLAPARPEAMDWLSEAEVEGAAGAALA